MEEMLSQVQHFTFREIRIINLAKEGFSNKEIANQLQIEMSTVKCHRRNIIRKLGIKGKTAFIKFLLTKATSH